MSLRRIAESGSYAVDLETDDATGEITAFVLVNLTKAAIDVRIEIAGQEIAKARVEPDKPLRHAIVTKGLALPAKEKDAAWTGPEYRVEVGGLTPLTRATGRTP